MALAVDASEIHRISTEKYHEFIECGALYNAHVELIDGLIVDMSPKGREHELIASWLNRRLAAALEPTYYLRVASSLTIGGSEPEPDIAVVKPGTPAPYHPASAELVIEISVSARRRDLVVKPPIYASAGVKEYWVIDLERSRVIVHQQPRGNDYNVKLEHGLEHSLDGSVVGIDPIPIAEIFAAAQGPG